MSSTRVSLGFDLRVKSSLRTNTDSQEIRSLEPAHAGAISADPSVWPRPEEASTLWSGLLPDFLNPLYLATNFDALRDAYDLGKISTSELCPLCVTGDSTLTISLNKQFGTGFFKTQFTEATLLSAGWEFRGFDVVDLDGLISGLKGCSYQEPVWSQLRKAYGSQLNDDGLFSDESVASRFAEVRGLEIRQHAPFIVVGILTHQSNADALHTRTSASMKA